MTLQRRKIAYGNRNDNGSNRGYQRATYYCALLDLRNYNKAANYEAISTIGQNKQTTIYFICYSHVPSPRAVALLAKVKKKVLPTKQKSV
jgi:hypothetical protein